MITITFVLCYGAAGFYVCGGILCVRGLRTPNPEALALLRKILIAAAAYLVGAFVLRWVTWGVLPMTRLSDVLTLFLVFSTVLTLWLTRQEEARVLQLFCVPLLAVMAVLYAAIVHKYVGEAPRAMRNGPLAMHVSMAFLAYAMFLVASMVSVAYAYQSHCLKRRRSSSLSRQLLPLDKLDRILFHEMLLGYIAFAVAVGSGLLWVAMEPDLLGSAWWTSPKVILSWVMLLFYAATYHSRKLGLLRGPKLAYVVFCGYLVLLATYLVLGVLDLSSHNFWGPNA